MTFISNTTRTDSINFKGRTSKITSKTNSNSAPSIKGKWSTEILMNILGPLTSSKSQKLTDGNFMTTVSRMSLLKNDHSSKKIIYYYYYLLSLKKIISFHHFKPKRALDWLKLVN